MALGEGTKEPQLGTKEREDNGMVFLLSPGIQKCNNKMDSLPTPPSSRRKALT